MANCNCAYSCFNLYDIANGINEVKYNVKGDSSQRLFEASVDSVRKTLEYLYPHNDSELVNLLSYDAYKFLIDSETDVDVSPDPDDSIEMTVTNNQPTDKVKNGLITKYNVDQYVDGVYYGSLSVSYVTEDGVNISRKFAFSKDRLTVETVIDGMHYLESITVENGELVYHVFGLSGIRCTKNSIETIVDNYIQNGGTEKIKLLFPEVFKPEYFKDYSVSTRTKK